MLLYIAKILKEIENFWAGRQGCRLTPPPPRASRTLIKDVRTLAWSSPATASGTSCPIARPASSRTKRGRRRPRWPATAVFDLLHPDIWKSIRQYGNNYLAPPSLLPMCQDLWNSNNPRMIFRDFLKLKLFHVIPWELNSEFREIWNFIEIDVNLLFEKLHFSFSYYFQFSRLLRNIAAQIRILLKVCGNSETSAIILKLIAWISNFRAVQKNVVIFVGIFWVAFPFGIPKVQNKAHLVDLEKCRRMRRLSLLEMPIQPRTSRQFFSNRGPRIGVAGIIGLRRAAHRAPVLREVLER